ncbi:hypothetical protein HHK36_010095 [Tetracentron sinense]|uniref:Major facilitator superfamily (MFS) profile domain-containing protein n=1 Tax=Tetracentron sinense TaxID=13715 RepID=A0A834ZGA6_TETSI|nr:hypothetical protein HHK36_010095 [Tetracentron sinense]
MDHQKKENNAVSETPQNPIVEITPPEKKKRNKFALSCAILASMNSILLGYDIGVISGAVIFIKDDLKINDTQVELLVGSLNFFSLIGSAVAGRTSDWIGRRYTIVVAAVIFFIGALLMGFATNYAFLMVGRFVAAIGVGYALVIAPVYTAEVSPASSRGFLTSLPDLFINGGILLGYVSNYAFSKLPEHLSWRFMLGVGAIPSVFLVFSVLTMPESPRWLVMQGRLGDAKQVLAKTSDSKEEAELRLADIKMAAGIPDDCTDEIVPKPKRSNEEAVWKELLLHPTQSVRRALIAAVGIHFFQQSSGIDAVVLYSPRIFTKAGIKGNSHLLLASVAVGFIKTSFILVATFLLDRVGRRPLLLSSVAGMILSLAGLGFGLTVVDHSDKRQIWAVALCITTVLSYVSFFSIGMGPITWVYSSEILPLRLRAQGASIGVAVNRGTSGVLAMSFISLSKAITIGGSFFLYAGIAIVAWVFFYTFLPETRGKTLEEMEVLFDGFKWRSFMKKKEKEEETSNGQVQLGTSNEQAIDLIRIPLASCAQSPFLFFWTDSQSYVSYFGLDIGVISGAVIFIKDDLKISDTQVELLVGILNLFSLIGSAAAGRTSDWIGRRYTIVVAAVIFFIGALLMGFATNYAFLMVGRFVAGIGVGYALVIAPVYTAEVSPASSRGFLTSLPEVFINGGILLGYVSNYAFSRLPEHLSWRFMLGVGAIPSVFLVFSVLTMPESPRWLVMQGRLGDAKRVLAKTSDSKEEAELRLADIKMAAGIPDDCTDEIVPKPKRSNEEAVWKELLLHPTPSVRRALIAAVGIHFFQQSSGIDAVVLYSPRIFKKAGIKRNSHLLLASVAVGFIKTSFILVATFLLDRAGRRPLLLSSVAGMILSLAGLGFGLTVVDHSDKRQIWAVALCITTVLSYVSFFSIGLGPITWVYSSEVLPLRLRAQGASIGVAVNRVTSGVLAMSFISLYKAITIGGSFFLFAGIAIVAWVFFYTFLPETRGKTLEEMEVLFDGFKWRSFMKKKDKKEETSNGQVQLGASNEQG